MLLSSFLGAVGLSAQRAAPLPAAPPLASAAASLAIRGVTVIDVQTGTRIANQTVVIVGRQVQTITSGTAPLPRGARVVDGRGKYLIPGLWDLHVHPMHTGDVAYPLFIANGVTGIRDAGSDVPLVTLNRWKQEIGAGTRVGPRMVVSGQSLDGPTGYDDMPNASHHRTLKTPSEARLAVDLLKSAGADMIKTYTLSREMVLAVAAEAKRIGIPFGGHFESVPGLEISDSGATFLDHMSWLSPDVCADSAGTSSDMVPEACRAAAAHLRRNNTWITIGGLPANDTTVDLVRILQRPLARFLPATFWPPSWPPRSVFLDSIRQRPGPLWSPETDSALRRLTPRPNTVVRAGMPIVVGTDATLPSAMSFLIFVIPGLSTHLTLASLVQEGMTPTEALQAATLNPARALRATDSLGTIEAGKRADLILLDADPLQAIWNTTKIHAVIADGRYYDRSALDGLLVQAERAAAAMRPNSAKSAP